jgi:fatty acid-binding protein DegV
MQNGVIHGLLLYVAWLGHALQIKVIRQFVHGKMVSRALERAYNCIHAEWNKIYNEKSKEK